MFRSIKIGRVLGIDFYLHSTFVLLLGVLLLVELFSGGIVAAFGSALFLTLLFGTVVLHELGHALAARRYGIPTHDITLLPIGGLARLARMPREPRQEMVVALAGPAVNAVLAGLAFLLLLPFQGAVALGLGLPIGGALLHQLLWINVSLGLFNLLPAFPMDGGRVLRAFLAGRMNYLRATEIAARTGQRLAFVLGAIGLFYNPMLLFVAFFVYTAAEQELRQVRHEMVVDPYAAFRGPYGGGSGPVERFHEDAGPPRRIHIVRRPPSRTVWRSW